MYKTRNIFAMVTMMSRSGLKLNDELEDSGSLHTQIEGETKTSPGESPVVPLELMDGVNVTLKVAGVADVLYEDAKNFAEGLERECKWATRSSLFLLSQHWTVKLQ